MYLINQKDRELTYVNNSYRNNVKKKLKDFVNYLKRVSADLEGPEKTSLLFDLWVMKGLIILKNARYHHGTLMNI